MKPIFIIATLITFLTPNIHAQDVKANHIEGKWATSRETEPVSTRLHFLLKIDGAKGRIVEGDKVTNSLYDSIYYDGNGVWSAIAYKPVINKDNPQYFRMLRSQAVKLKISPDKHSLFELPGNIELERRGMYPGEQEDIDRIIKTLPPSKRPSDVEFGSLCYKVGQRDSGVLIDIKRMSGVEPGDDRLTMMAKVQRMFLLYYDLLGCDSTGFPIEYGNVFKYSVHKNYYIFVDQLIDNFNININLKDPSDGKTLLDFIQDEVVRYEKMPAQMDKAAELKNLYKHFKNNLGAKHSVELKN